MMMLSLVTARLDKESAHNSCPKRVAWPGANIVDDARCAMTQRS